MPANEFRKDLVSGEWVLISSLRAMRPHNGNRIRLSQTAAECVFEPPRLAGEVPLIAYDRGRTLAWPGDWGGSWTTAVIKNKYPAVQHGVCGVPGRTGPFETYAANGYHELVLTRDHEKHFSSFTTGETAEVLRAYRDRYRAIMADECGAYISMFHNHGAAAGASVMHNHSQILSTPIVPPEVLGSLQGADTYFRTHGRGVHRALIDWELSENKRVVHENAQFIAFCPFVSKAGYEVRIFPKTQEAHFEQSGDDSLHDCADALNVVLRKLYRVLDDVDYNFYIHTAPVAREPGVNYDYYHWHIEVVPRIPVAAGFELSTAIYINPFDPDDCARQLRETPVS